MENNVIVLSEYCAEKLGEGFEDKEPFYLIQLYMHRRKMDKTNNPK